MCMAVLFLLFLSVHFCRIQLDKPHKISGDYLNFHFTAGDQGAIDDDLECTLVGYRKHHTVAGTTDQTTKWLEFLTERRVFPG